MTTLQWGQETVTVASIDVHLSCAGQGPPLFLLDSNPEQAGTLRYHQTLAEHFRVYVPSHPGFGITPRLEWATRLGDLSVFYLWMLEELGLQRVHLVGHAVGGWLAADLAVTCPQAVERLILVDAMGVKPQGRDILDIFLLTPQQVRDAAFYRSEQVPEWDQLYGRQPTLEQADRAEEALETLVRLCWKPYMYDPRLPALLPRMKQPSLVIWGREDAIVPLECGELYQQGLGDAQLVVLDECGHCPQLEKPQAFVNAVLAFLH